jgi:hypothetical protein
MERLATRRDMDVSVGQGVTGVETIVNTSAGNENGATERVIGGRVYELRYADLDKDSSGLAELYRETSSLPHLSGVAPRKQTKELNVERYAQKYNKYNIIFATEEDIREYYKDYHGGKDSKGALLVVEVAVKNKKTKKQSKQIVGAVTVPKLSGRGMGAGEIGGLVVRKNFRGNHIAAWLLETAHALAFLPEEMGGFGMAVADVGIIWDLPTKEHHEESSAIHEKIFIPFGYPKEGEEGAILQPLGYCVSWDPKLKRFIERRSMRLQLSARQYFETHDISEMKNLLLPSKREKQLVLFDSTIDISPPRG